MITYKTSPERIISILKEITSLNGLKVKVTDYDEESIKLKRGQFDFTINCKKKNKETTVLIDCNFTPIGKPSLMAGSYSNIGDEKLTNAIIKFINDNLNENEYTENSREFMDSIQKPTIQNFIINKFQYFIPAFIILGIFVWMIIWFTDSSKTTSSTANNKVSKKIVKSIPKGVVSHEISNGTLKAYYYTNYMINAEYCAIDVMHVAYRLATNNFPNINKMELDYGLKYSNKYDEEQETHIGTFIPDINNLRRYDSRYSYSSGELGEQLNIYLKFTRKGFR